MKTQRFWTGMALITAACVLVIVMTSPGYSRSAAGRVEGRITYRGQPLKGGSIVFLSGDRKRCDDQHVMIDDRGYYQAGASWHRDCPGGVSFRILVFVDPRRDPLDPPPGSDAMASPGGASGQGARGVAGRRPNGKIRRASWVPVRGDRSDPPPRPIKVHRFSDPRRSDLAVTLGPGPARVDIDLTD